MGEGIAVGTILSSFMANKIVEDRFEARYVRSLAIASFVAAAKMFCTRASAGVDVLNGVTDGAWVDLK